MVDELEIDDMLREISSRATERKAKIVKTTSFIIKEGDLKKKHDRCS